MIKEFLQDKEFFNSYIQNYALRQAIANMQLENKNSEMVTSLEANDELIDNMVAFKWIFEASPSRISPYDLNEIAYRVNGEQFGIGFRKTNVTVNKAKNFTPCSPSQIPEAVYSLFNAYRNIWTDLSPYEREARLHIELVRIQPYQDGNKRSARILTSYNLFSSDRSPVIIPGEETDEYFGYIDNNDVEGMAKYLERRSKLEYDFMVGSYNRHNIKKSKTYTYTNNNKTE